MSVKTFRERIKKIRQEKKLTIVKVANEIGITRQSLSRYESSIIPNIEVLCRLAKYYGVSSDYLIGLTDCPEIKECKDTGTCKCMASRIENQLQNMTLVTLDADGDIIGGGMSLADLLPSSFFEVD